MGRGGLGWREEALMLVHLGVDGYAQGYRTNA